MELEGWFYDGQTAAPERVLVRLSLDGVLTIDHANADAFTCPIGDLLVHDRVGAASPRSVELPSGALLHLPPDPAFDALLDRLTRRDGGWIRLLESRWQYAAAALLFVLISTWGFIRFGVPLLATKAAERVSPTVAARVGDLALKQFDEQLLAPSKLDPARQHELETLFNRDIASSVHTQPPLHLVFRLGRAIGPNALALPGGTIVITDQLVNLSHNDQELLLVLAHEAGHEIHRHSLAHLFAGIGTTLVVVALTGDLSSPASLAAAAPAILIQSGYSRADERIADRFAFDWADAHGIPRTRLTDLLARIDKTAGGMALPTLLSSHPSTAERRAVAKRRR